MNELKPCPFCGAILELSGSGRKWDTRFATHPYFKSPAPCIFGGQSFEVTDEWVAIWNTRPDSPGEEEDVVWFIQSPSGGGGIRVRSFEEAMETWFEGFNVPWRLVDGLPEPLEASRNRVREYFRQRHRTRTGEATESREER